MSTAFNQGLTPCLIVYNQRKISNFFCHQANTTKFWIQIQKFEKFSSQKRYLRLASTPGTKIWESSNPLEWLTLGMGQQPHSPDASLQQVFPSGHWLALPGQITFLTWYKMTRINGQGDSGPLAKKQGQVYNSPQAVSSWLVQCWKKKLFHLSKWTGCPVGQSLQKSKGQTLRIF